MGSNPTLSARSEPPFPVTEILYRSDRLEVRRVRAGDGRHQVVTFDSYHEPPGLARPGFGEAFFAHENITAIHVLSFGNDWFQYPETESVLSLIREAGRDAERLMTYGSSMGGYAALRFAAAVGAHSALALSPQYSVNRWRARFETRWAADRRRIRFIKALEKPIAQIPLMVVAFDQKNDLDCGHFVRLLAEARVEGIPMPFAGHPVGPFLNDIGLLRPLVLSVLDGAFEGKYFCVAAQERSETSPHWLANVAEQAPLEHAILLARRAVSLAPDHPNLHDALARRLSAAGRYDEAIEAHQRAIALDPIVDYRWGLSKTLYQAGKLNRALAVVKKIQQLTPSTAGYYAWSAKLREELGDTKGALADLRTASRNDPNNRGYRVAIFGLMARSAYTWLRRAWEGS